MVHTQVMQKAPTHTLNIGLNTFHTVLAFLINSVLAFIIYRLTIQSGGIEALGIWTTLTAWMILIRLTDAGMTSAITRFASCCDAAAEPIKIREYVDTVIVMSATLSIFIAIPAWLAVSFNLDVILRHDREAIVAAENLVLPIFAIFLFQSWSALALSALQAIHLGYVSAWLSVGGTIVQLGLVLWLVPTTGLLGLALAQLVHFTLLTCASWLLFLIGLKRASGVTGSMAPITASWPAAQEIYRFSLSAQATNIANGFFEPLSKVLIGRFGGLDLLGVYEVAHRIISVPRNLVVSGVLAGLPASTHLMRQDPEAAFSLYRRTHFLTVSSSAAVLIVMVLAVPLFEEALLGYSEPRLMLLVALLALGFFGNCWGATAYTIGLASGRLRGNLEAAMISNSLLIALCFGLTPFLGSWSSVLASVMSIAIGGIWVWHRNRRLVSHVHVSGQI